MGLLDGLASFLDTAFAVTRGSEEVAYADFLESLNQGSANPFFAREAAKARRDPSGDDYHYFLDANFFEDPQFFPNGAASVQQRFGHFFSGVELNSFEAQEKLSPAVDARGNARLPDTEDIKGAMEIGANAFNIVTVWRNRKREEALQDAKSDEERQEAEAKPSAILNVAKQRNGDFEGKVKLAIKENAVGLYIKRGDKVIYPGLGAGKCFSIEASGRPEPMGGLDRGDRPELKRTNNRPA